MVKIEKKIGFIGLGVMGKPMAKNLLNAGYRLTVHNRSSKPVKELVAIGAKPASTPREVAEASNIVITSLPSTSEVRDVILGENGIIKSIQPKNIIIDTSTIDPLASKHIAEELGKKDAYFLDAPVSGGPEKAEKATLTFMIGGEKHVMDECIEIFHVLGMKIFYVGLSGSGEIVKLINQILVGLNFVTVSEALILSIKAGVDPKILYEVIKTSAGNSVIFERAIPQMIRREFGQGFQTRLLHKDLGLILDLSSNLSIPMIFTSLAKQIFTSAMNLGLDHKDAASVIEVFEKFTNINVKE